jgi:NADH-quinone oxidoreductase subunit N
MSPFYTATDHFVLLPVLLLALFGCSTLLFDFFVFPRAEQRKWLMLFVVMGEVFAGVAFWKQQSFLMQHGGAIEAFGGALRVDQFGLFFQWVLLATTLLVGLISYRYLEVKDEHHGEYYGLLLLAQCGMFFLAAGNELVTLFVGLETMAVTVYVLVGFLRGDQRSNEAALKYLLLGGFSSGFLAYGFSILYGISGSTKLGEIALAVSNREPNDPLLLLAIATVSVGLFFKISAAPFHMWAPDAYEGAPTTVTAFLAVGSKAASFALLVRIFLVPLGPVREMWEPILIGAALLSMTIGNLAAITQTNTKRLLAYSSVNHAGYILLGVIAGGETGITGVLVYLLVYTFMNIGAFLVIASLTRKGISGEDIDDMKGLMKKSPAHAIWMLIFLLSLAGIPPTAGFIGKYFIFLALLKSGHYVLAVVAVLYVAVAIFYYLRMVKSMFVSKADAETPALTTSFGMQVALGVTGALTLLIGIYPEPFVQMARQTLGGR